MKCERCGGMMNLKVGYTGADWNSDKGEGSGYGYEVQMSCDKCGQSFVLGYCRRHDDIVPPKKK